MLDLDLDGDTLTAILERRTPGIYKAHGIILARQILLRRFDGLPITFKRIGERLAHRSTIADCNEAVRQIAERN